MNKQGVLIKIQKHYLFQPICKVLIIVFISTNLFPIQNAFALTSGPSQPEADTFQQVDVSNMVDPFTGNFSYNIPLMNVGGYPINLSYASDITMDQEATWAGLGWNVNVGAITRSLRGLPDDFWGDTITRNYNVKPNQTWGVNVGFDLETFGLEINKLIPMPRFGLDISYNNYTGFNLAKSVTSSISAGSGASINASLGLSASSQGGLGISPNVSFSAGNKIKNKVNLSGSIGFGLPMNSRTGLSNLTLNTGVSVSSAKKVVFNNETNQYENVDRKKGGSLGSLSSGASISMATSSYTPQIDIPLNTLSMNFSGKLGLAAWGIDGDVEIAGYYSEQRLPFKRFMNPGYGYIYSERGNRNPHALFDFNREKDGSISIESPTLPVTAFTYDVFDIQAQGIGGSFRGFRNDVGHVYDKSTVNSSSSGSAGFETSGSSIIDVGFNISMNIADAASNDWTLSNWANPVLQFQNKGVNNLYENVNFKLAGEYNVDSDISFFNNTLGSHPAKFVLDKSTSDVALTNQITSQSGNKTFSQYIKRTTRQNRTTSITYLTVGEIKQSNPSRARMISKYAKDHHIGEITITTNDGTRYVFGLAAYNYEKREITFAVGANKRGNGGLLPNAENLVTYASRQNSVENDKGIDNYYDETITPPYAHTWYLTEVLSPDYVDVTGNGVTEDDLGSYTKFTYGVWNSSESKYVPNVASYKWRTPTSKQAFRADYNQGLITDITDDKANIVYGEKEVWYVNTIESKTQVAKFYLSDREDGYGVSGVNGGVDTDPRGALKRVDRISLFSKEEYKEDPLQAIPIKTAHFDYDYSLCKNAPNNKNTGANSGKLTLKRVYFSYQKSNRARFSPYVFNYNETITNHNPDYDTQKYDRWGFYKTPEVGLKNSDYPYTDQDKVVQDVNCAVWSLKSVQLPSGGIINISYESDDYGYVQDKKATRMFKVKGVGMTKDAASSNLLYQASVCQYLYFDLENSIPTSQITSDQQANQLIKSLYLEDNNNPNGAAKNLYFRFLLRVNDGTSIAKNEYVSGYIEPESCGVRSIIGGQYTQGWIKVKLVQTEDSGALNAHPISKAGWQFSRIYTPKYAFHQPEPDDSDFVAMMKVLGASNIFKQLLEFMQGTNNRLRNQGFASTFEPDKSWIKLIDPDARKLGGGSRVKKIELSDNWNTMNPSEASFSYGQEYIYELEDGKSSGVAAFEPAMGADENALKTPIFAGTAKKLLVPDDRFYQEEPIGESFFPAPTVGYSRVEVRNLQYTNVKANATGHVVHNFYTAKDFPTIASRTPIDFAAKKSNPLMSLLKLKVFDYLTATQGFVVELNDMHGKQKSQEVYAEGKRTPISKVEYYYKTQGNKITNAVPVVLPNGNIEDRPIGIDYDLVVDMREQSSNSEGTDIQLNIASFIIPPIPIPVPIPTVIPSFSKEETRFRSATITKVINRYAVLEKTVSYDVDARVETNNIAWDSKTGQVLLTQVNNEFEDDRYAFTYPAHFAYVGMGAATTNVGFEFVDQNQNYWNRTTGRITGTVKNYLRPGDELLPSDKITARRILNTVYTKRAWVAEHSNGDYYLIDAWGNPLTTTKTNDMSFKVIRSGMRNMQTTNIGAVESLEPLIDNNKIKIDNTRKILTASATEYAEQWKMNNNQGLQEITCTGANSKLENFINLVNTLSNDGNLVTNNANISLSSLYPTLTANIWGAGCSINYESNSYSSNLCTPPSSSPSPMINMRITSDDCPYIESRCIELFIAGVGNINTFPISNWDSISFVSNNIIDYVPPGYCSGEFDFLPNPNNPNYPLFFEAVMDNGGKQYFYISKYFEGCFDFEFQCDTLDCVFKAGDKVNPYLRGILGNWRPLKSYTYLTERQNTNIATSVNVRNDGYYTAFAAFWNLPSGAGVWPKVTGTPSIPWKWTAEMTNYSPWGFDVENKDPLGNYSAALYGYKNTLPIAVAQNAQYKEIGFDGFEDYYPTITWNDCDQFHFKFKNYKHKIEKNLSHTGNYSLRVDTNEAVSNEYTITAPLCQRGTRAVPYLLQSCDLLGYFGPNNNYLTPQRFILNFWMREANPLGKFDYSNLSADVTINSTSVVIPGSLKKSKVIEEWQQYEIQFYVPAAASGNIKIEIHNAGSLIYHIDDIRVQPVQSTMKSFVYDAITLRYLAALDENNYATFYEYDEDGALVRVKKETERGIMTIQENRSNNFKRNLQ